MFYLLRIFRTSSLGDSISGNPEITAPKRWGQEPGYIEVLQQRASGLNIKRLLLIKGNQISQFKEFSFSMYGKMQESGFTDIIPFAPVSAIWGQYLFLSHPELLRARSREWLQSAGSSRSTSPSWVPLGSGTHGGGLDSLMTVTSLFTDMAGNSPFLTNIHITIKFDIFQYSTAVLSAVSLVILGMHLSGWSRDSRHMK